MYTKEQLEIKEKVENIVWDICGENGISCHKIEFIIKKDESIVFGIKDYAYETPEEYVIELAENGYILHKIPSFDELDEDEPEMNSRIEKEFLEYLCDEFEIVDLRLHFHFDMWDFFDEFLYCLSLFEDGMHVYLKYCQEKGITEKFISANSFIATDNYFLMYPPSDEHNKVTYSHIIKQRIDDKELCLSYLGSLNTTENFRVTFIIDGILSDVKSFKTLKEASELYMEIYRDMTKEGEKAALHTFKYMIDFIDEERNDRKS